MELVHLVAQAGLEYRSVLLGPFPSNFRVAIAQLEKVAKDWDSWNFRDPFDLRHVCTVEVADSEEDDRDDDNQEGGVGHGERFRMLENIISKGCQEIVSSDEGWTYTTSVCIGRGL